MNHDLLRQRAIDLKLHGLISHWEAVRDEPWIESVLSWEEEERSHRSLERRLKSAHIGPFKPLIDFNWNWPKKCDREAIEELMQLDFMQGMTNVIFCGPNGVGKSTLARNIAYQAVIRGFTVLFTTAEHMLNEVASQDGAIALRRRIKYYVQPQLLIIDEVGYLSYSSRYADLMFQIVSARYLEKSTMITTNKPFAEWGEIFTNASCVVSLIDRLVHHSEIISIDADSYRLKEAKEESTKRKVSREKMNNHKNKKTEDLTRHL